MAALWLGWAGDRSGLMSSQKRTVLVTVPPWWLHNCRARECVGGFLGWGADWWGTLDVGSRVWAFHEDGWFKKRKMYFLWAVTQINMQNVFGCCFGQGGLCGLKRRWDELLQVKVIWWIIGGWCFMSNHCFSERYNGLPGVWAHFPTSALMRSASDVGCLASNQAHKLSQKLCMDSGGQSGFFMLDSKTIYICLLASGALLCSSTKEPSTD